MFNFSSKTYVNKEYKLSDFLKQIKAKKEVKEDAKKIDKIIFENVISANSMNVEEEQEYKNIYVIRIKLKTNIIPRLFIEELDKNIKFHTYFICEFNNEVCTLIAYKNISTKVKIDSKYYGHGFRKEEMINLPTTSKVSDVYRMMLEYEIGIKSKNYESPSEYIARVKLINRLEFQISKTTKAILYETQPKKKFEYNERLRKYKKDLDELKEEK